MKLLTVSVQLLLQCIAPSANGQCDLLRPFMNSSIFFFQVRQLPEYGYNRGALLAAAHLLSDSNDHLRAAAGVCTHDLNLYFC